MDVKLTDWSKPPDLIARVLSPLGLYPAKSIVMPESAFIADNDICFTLANSEIFKVEDENYYSEMAWAQLEEIRLFASMLLSINSEHGFTRIYPFPFPEGILLKGKIDFENQNLVTKIKELLINKINAPEKQTPGYPEPQRNLYRCLNGISLPPSNGGVKLPFLVPRNSGV
jgi:hypothetical protein